MSHAFCRREKRTCQGGEKVNMATIRIGDITIDNVEVSSSGLVRKIGGETRFRNTSVEEDVASITSNSLRYLVTMVYNIQNSGHDITRINKPVLLEHCQKFLGCSERTAYNYVKAMVWLGALFVNL